MSGWVVRQLRRGIGVYEVNRSEGGWGKALHTQMYNRLDRGIGRSKQEKDHSLRPASLPAPQHLCIENSPLNTWGDRTSYFLILEWISWLQVPWLHIKSRERNRQRSCFSIATRIFLAFSEKRQKEKKPSLFLSEHSNLSNDTEQFCFFCFEEEQEVILIQQTLQIWRAIKFPLFNLHRKMKPKDERYRYIYP